MRIKNFQIFEEMVYLSVDMRQILYYIAHTKNNKLSLFLLDMMQQTTYDPDIDFIDLGTELNKLTFMSRNRINYDSLDISKLYADEKRQSIKIGRLIRRLLDNIEKELNYTGIYYIANVKDRSHT